MGHRSSATRRQAEPHGIQVLNAVNIYWRQHMPPVGGESPTLGHQAASWLSVLVSYAMSNQIVGVPLRLGETMQERLTGYSGRHCRRLRAVCERHGLISVVPGSNYGGGTAPEITLNLSRIVDIPRLEIRTKRRRPMTMTRTRKPSVAQTRTEGLRMESGSGCGSVGSESLTRTTSTGSTSEISEPEHEGAEPERKSEPHSVPAVSHEDAELAAPVVRVWQVSKKYSPRRRKDLAAAIRSDRDALMVRRIAELRRTGVSESRLCRCFAEVVSAYAPALDPRSRCPWIVSLAWFEPHVEWLAEENRSRAMTLSNEWDAAESRRRKAELERVPTDAELAEVDGILANASWRRRCDPQVAEAARDALRDEARRKADADKIVADETPTPLVPRFQRPAGKHITAEELAEARRMFVGIEA